MWCRADINADGEVDFGSDALSLSGSLPLGIYTDHLLLSLSVQVRLT